MSESRSEPSTRLTAYDVVRAPALAEGDVVQHGFFTRRGGVSEGIYAGLNVGYGSDDDRTRVAENRAKALAYMGLSDGDFVTPWQVHSPDAIVVEAPFEGERPKADGIVTSRPGLAIGVVTADCGPILFADAKNGVVGAAHAGWRGALGGVLETTIAAMESVGAERDAIRAVLGPTITQPQYEVGIAMMDEFLAGDATRERFFAPGRAPDKRQFDLPGFILARLVASGVSASFVGLCTYTEPDRFFSFRRTTHRGEPDYGRQLSAIALRD